MGKTETVSTLWECDGCGEERTAAHKDPANWIEVEVHGVGEQRLKRGAVALLLQEPSLAFCEPCTALLLAALQQIKKRRQ